MDTQTIKQILNQAAQRMQTCTVQDLFKANPQRKAQYSIEAAGLKLDYSHHLVDEDILNTLIKLARSENLDQAIHALFNGHAVNQTENRAALHTAFRTPADDLPHAQLIQDMQNQMQDIVTRLHSNAWLGATKEPITDVVHLGIGGSYWGPQCLLDALADHPTYLRVHCIAELDHHALDDLLVTLNPEHTLFIVASKSFTTYETLENAKRAIAWLQQQLQQDVSQHLIGITEQMDKAVAFGIPRNQILPMWDWVGGRYSIWSSMALPVCLRYGMQIYWDFLAGAKAMDEHFLTTDWTRNMPVILALLSHWATQYQHMPAEVILPYPYRLRSIIPHLQQLSMESLGKACTLEGKPINTLTGPMLWGCLGSQAQHTFNQWLQQSPCITPVEFILPTYDKQLLAQGLAQSQALAFGDPHPNVHARLTGSRPHHILYVQALNAQTLGALLALYEHKVFCFATLLHINPFDQFGVEHSKKIARDLLMEK